MKEIKSYDDLNIHPLQQIRLYIHDRPLFFYWRSKVKNISNFKIHSDSTLDIQQEIKLIRAELKTDFIAIDCAGWYFANKNLSCKAIEINEISKICWKDVHFEYDYLTWHPTYLPDWPVLAYYSTYFKYCELEDFISFCMTWSNHHSKIIIGLDPTKIKFNYLKYNLLELLKTKINHAQFRILNQDHFRLLFVMENI